MNEQYNVKKREFYKDSPMSKAGIFIKMAAIIVIIFVLIISANSLMEYSDILKETENIEQQIDKTQEHVEELEYLINAPQNDKSMIIRIAREKLGLVLPEEVVYYSEPNK
jgi:cell division protein FtsB